MRLELMQAGVPDRHNTVFTRDALKKCFEDMEKNLPIPIYDKPGGSIVIGETVSLELSKDGTVLYASVDMYPR